jgi:Cu/Ag efflux protein CusF
MVGANSSNMDPRAVPANAKTATGTGTVMAVDKSASTIALDHGPIPQANWPAMTMTFKAAPGVHEGVQPGEKVSFDLVLANGSGEVTAVHKQ